VGDQSCWLRVLSESPYRRAFPWIFTLAKQSCVRDGQKTRHEHQKNCCRSARNMYFCLKRCELVPVVIFALSVRSGRFQCMTYKGEPKVAIRRRSSMFSAHGVYKIESWSQRCRRRRRLDLLFCRRWRFLGVLLEVSLIATSTITRRHCRTMMESCNSHHVNTYCGQWRSSQSHTEASSLIRQPGITGARAVLQAREEQVRR
jgi:hypothetical protein